MLWGIGLSKGFLGSENLIPLQDGCFVGEISAFGVGLLLLQVKGASGCPAAVVLVMPPHALIAVGFLLKDGCGGVGQGP